MREVRKFLITHLVCNNDFTIGKWWQNRLALLLITWVDIIVSERKDQVERKNVRLVYEYKFQVWDGGVEEGLVNIRCRTYNYRVFKLD